MTRLLRQLPLRPAVHVAGAEPADCAGRVRQRGGPVGRVASRTDLPPTGLGLCRALLLAECALSTGFRQAVSRGHGGGCPLDRCGTRRHTPPIRPPQGQQAALFLALPFSSTTAQPGNGGPGTGLAAPGVPARGRENPGLGARPARPTLTIPWRPPRAPSGGKQQPACGMWGRGWSIAVKSVYITCPLG